MRKIRYAVVGLGHITQNAVLPAFRHARSNSELVALVSGNSEKLHELGQRYRLRNLFSYNDFDACLDSGVDAVYIATPNSLHRPFTERAAQKGIHVLCEKPMAATDVDCEAMIRAAAEGNVKLMIGYRLHFEKANLRAVELAQSGRLGDLRLFISRFSMQVQPANIRLRRELGEGTLYDIGIYCINAARYLFRSEPEEVFSFTARGSDPRFTEVEESVAATLRFPGDRLATFVCSFGGADGSMFELVGTKGTLRLGPAFDYSEPLRYQFRIGNTERRRTFARHDQFAAELLYFSDCILNNADPEPSGFEGLADVRIIQALYESAQKGMPVRMAPTPIAARPDPSQEINQPPVSPPPLFEVQPPSQQ